MDSLSVLDQYKLNFSPEGLHALNVIIAIIMFGVALGIDVSNFKTIVSKPKAFLVGIISQFLLLPAVTFLLVLVIQPTESVALGLILVAACPGGNVSNFICSLAKGNIELSVSLTGASTLLSVLMTPINFAFWGALYVHQSQLIQPIEIDFLQMFQTVILILGAPLFLGILFAKRFTKITSKILKPTKILSILFFGAFVVMALANNFSLFLRYIHLFIFIVFAHNLLALATGYFVAKSFKLDGKDRRSISIETGIQNSGLALVLIFNPKIFPESMEIGGMAFIAAWWGIWHIIAGLSLAYFWSRKPYSK